MNDWPVLNILTEESFERLGRSLFEYQESILPEGETWESLTEGDRAFWRNSVKVVILNLQIVIIAMNETSIASNADEQIPLAR